MPAPPPVLPPPIVASGPASGWGEPSGGLLADIPEVDDWSLPPPKAARDWTDEVLTPAPPPLRPPSKAPSPSRAEAWQPEPSWGNPSTPAWEPEPPEPLPEASLDSWTPSISPTLDWLQAEPDPPPMPAPPAPALSVEPGMRSNLRPSLKAVSDVLNDLLAATNAHLSSFKMTQRLLSKHARIPAAMLQSTHPYLQEIQERLVPVLRQITPFHGITDEAVKKLESYCRELRRADLSPSQLKDDIPKKMERLLLFLGALRSAVPNL